MSGWHDIPLSHAGWRETEQVSARLREEGLVGPVICSSPLQRCRCMAEAIARATGGTIELEDDLREIYCGELEGVTIGHARTRHADLWADNLSEERDDFRWPGGESYSEFRDRCLKCLDRIRQRHPTGALIIVTHAGVISQLLGALEGSPSRRWSAHRPSNASLCELGDDGRHLTLKSFDDHRHLTGDWMSRREGRGPAYHAGPAPG